MKTGVRRIDRGQGVFGSEIGQAGKLEMIATHSVLREREGKACGEKYFSSRNQTLGGRKSSTNERGRKWGRKYGCKNNMI